MKLSIKWSLMLATVLLTACSVSPVIHTTASPDLDLSQYRTFGYIQPLDTDKRYESLLSQFLKQATSSALIQRGFVYDPETPDLLINFGYHVIDKQQVEQIPVTLGYVNHYNDVYYGAWPTYRLFVDDYQQGILSIDLVDRKRNTMIWQGIATQRLTARQRDQRQVTIQRAVHDIFQHFPAQPEK